MLPSLYSQIKRTLSCLLVLKKYNYVGFGIMKNNRIRNAALQRNEVVKFSIGEKRHAYMGEIQCFSNFRCTKRKIGRMMINGLI